jgi:hypothetical protein
VNNLSLENRNYYQERASRERIYALEAQSPQAADLHLKLARFYEKILEQSGQLSRPKLIVIK